MTFLKSLKGKKDIDTVEKRLSYPLEKEIADVDDLYILGDFFDFWFSKGSTIDPEFSDVVNTLSELQNRGINIHLCEGNHDFLLTEFFHGRLGMEVIRDWSAIALDGRRVFIAHGDTIDEKNTRYLLMRRLFRSRFVYKLQRRCPIVFLRWAAQIFSYLNKEFTTETDDSLANKMRSFSMGKFHDGFDAVVLGHCHKHHIEEPVVDGNKKTFALLGDWVRHYSYLCYENGTFVLEKFYPAECQK